MLGTLEELQVSHGILPNVWGLVTAENQKQLNERVPYLLQCPLAVRGVSIEPMLGAMDVSPYLWTLEDKRFGDVGPIRPPLNWIIAGAETGPGARPMDPDWARGAGVPFFFKKMSKKAPIPNDLMIREWPLTTTYQLCYNENS
jgi:protein gp37